MQRMYGNFASTFVSVVEYLNLISNFMHWIVFFVKALYFHIRNSNSSIFFFSSIVLCTFICLSCVSAILIEEIEPSSVRRIAFVYSSLEFALHQLTFFSYKNVHMKQYIRIHRISELLSHQCVPNWICINTYTDDRVLPLTDLADKERSISLITLAREWALVATWGNAAEDSP